MGDLRGSCRGYAGTAPALTRRAAATIRALAIQGFPRMNLSEVRAVITGGVSGLGLATAQHLAAKGAKVALFDVNEEKGAQAAAALKATFHKVDVTSEA